MGLSSSELEAEIAALSARMDAVMHRMLHLIRLYDDTGQWGWQGHRSCSAWLSWRTVLEVGAARERVRVARALAELPLIDAALSRGELSYSNVRAMTRVATPELEWLSPADAVMRMAGEVLAGDGAAPAGDGPPRSGGDRHEMSLHLTREMFGEGFRAKLDDGTAVPAETFRRVACDASLVPHLEDETGQTLDVGRRTRSIPPAIRRALRARQPHCAFPSCAHRRFLDAHHVEHWLDGGETKLSNLVHLCRVHHRLVHEDGYTVDLARDGQPLFRTPAGFPIVAVPSRPPSRGSLPSRPPSRGNASDVRFHSYGSWSHRVDYDACVSAVVGAGA